jgi:hypothetical protein
VAGRPAKLAVTMWPIRQGLGRGGRRAVRASINPGLWTILHEESRSFIASPFPSRAGTREHTIRSAIVRPSRSEHGWIGPLSRQDTGSSRPWSGTRHHMVSMLAILA